MAYQPIYHEAGNYKEHKWNAYWKCYSCGNKAPTPEELVHTDKYGICKYCTQESMYWEKYYELASELPDDVDEWTDEILEEHNRKMKAIEEECEVSKWMLNRLPESEYNRIMKNRRG